MRISAAAHAALAASVSVRQNGGDGSKLDVGVWAPPGPNDIRSPCPGLNTLANHGYLPRDGRNIHISDIVTAMDQHLGIASDFGLVQVAGAAVRGAFSFLSDGGLGLESFDALTNSHNQIEHDASFTRDDLAFGSNVIKNTTQIESMIAHSEDGVTLTVEQIADARHARLKDSFSRNPSPRGLAARVVRQ
ncbi:Cloroperoxidase [Exidia glandulosa HHB12029]|uniref:Cloroperoxidase n=1 Tax=Exidia glandulosa HHB12029 TaxID=1314781 RepID=A0A165EKL8_EXIGL|nr:Cloroperoxidase [Exidia glandulosa HHB12029]